MTKDDIVNMRNLMIFAVVAMAVAVAIIPAEGTDADGVAEVYFFDADNVCIGQVYLIPGEPIKDTDIPWHGSYKEWYDEDARKIYAGVTFEAGPHTVRACDIYNPPTPSQKSEGGGGLSTETIALIISGAVAITSTAAIVLIMRRK